MIHNNIMYGNAGTSKQNKTNNNETYNQVMINNSTSIMYIPTPPTTTSSFYTRADGVFCKAAKRATKTKLN